MAFIVEPMQIQHIPAVMAVERLSFPVPWPASAYRKEIQGNRMAHYFVARHLDAEGEPVDALLVDEVRPRSIAGRTGLLERLARWVGSGPSDSAVATKSDVDVRSIMAYAGMWVVPSSDAHITTIAVHPIYRGRGVGELLLVQCIDRALEIGAERMTLEVRVSNAIAKQLYEKYQFDVQGRRSRYYSDNGEDADIMTTPEIGTADYRRILARNRAELEARLARDG